MAEFVIGCVLVVVIGVLLWRLSHADVDIVDGFHCPRCDNVSFFTAPTKCRHCGSHFKGKK